MKNVYSSLRILERSSLSSENSITLFCGYCIVVIWTHQNYKQYLVVKMVHLKSHFSFNCNFKATLAIFLEARLISSRHFSWPGAEGLLQGSILYHSANVDSFQDSKLGQSICSSSSGWESSPSLKEEETFFSKLIVRKHESHLEPESSRRWIRDFNCVARGFVCVCVFCLHFLFYVGA